MALKIGPHVYQLDLRNLAFQLVGSNPVDQQSFLRGSRMFVRSALFILICQNTKQALSNCLKNALEVIGRGSFS